MDAVSTEEDITERKSLWQLA